MARKVELCLVLSILSALTNHSQKKLSTLNPKLNLNRLEFITEFVETNLPIPKSTKEKPPNPEETGLGRLWDLGLILNPLNRV